MSLIDLLIVLAKHKKLIIGLPILTSICAVLLSLLLPNIYKADTKILPPQQSQGAASALLSQIGGVSGAAAVAGIKNPNDIYIGMLKSRTIADNLIRRFDLMKVYDEEFFEGTRKTLAENTTIKSGKDNIISIEVEDKSPKRAAQIANAYSDELLKLTKVLAVTEASQRRLFLERQVNLAKDNLTLAESTLKGGLDTKGVMSADGAMLGMVTTVAQLRAQIVAKEIQLSAMQSSVTPENQIYKQNQQELASMKNTLAKLENGKPELANVPTSGKQGGIENMKALRDLKHYQMLYELLLKQYEIARLDESKDAAIIQVLDKAIEPEKKAGPKRALITIACGLLAFLLAVFWAFSIQGVQSARLEFKKRLKES